MNTIRYVFDVVPVSAPRMTQRDKWKKRPCVMAYFAFRDEIRRQASKVGFVLPESNVHMIFHLPMPKSWSSKKKEMMDGQPHRQKIDIDNAVKALMDSLLISDCGVWDLRATKYWSSNPRIEIVVPDKEASHED